MEHLDEGTIHTWLDGELSSQQAAAVEQHVRTCAVCSQLVAEARGLTAASSRILGALDEVPGNVVPLSAGAFRERISETANPQVEPRSAAQRKVQRAWYRRPQFAAAAALMIVAAGTWRVVREQPNATIADFAAPTVLQEAPANTVIDSGALSGATAAEVASADASSTSNSGAAGAEAKKSDAPRAAVPGSPALDQAAAERESAPPGPSTLGRAQNAPPPAAIASRGGAGAANVRRTEAESIATASADRQNALRQEEVAKRTARLDSVAMVSKLSEVTTTSTSSASRATPVRSDLVDSAVTSESRRLAGERAAALSMTKADSAARERNQAPPLAAAGANARDAAPADAAIVQAAGCYDVGRLRAIEASLPTRIRLLAAVARTENDLVWYAAQGYPETTAGQAWVWRIVPAAGIQLSRVDQSRRVLTLMLSGPSGITADRITCP